MGRLTTIVPPSHPLEPRSFCTKRPQSVDPGHPMALTAGTLVPLLTMTAAGVYSSHKHPTNGTPTRLNSFPPPFQCLNCRLQTPPHRPFETSFRRSKIRIQLPPLPCLAMHNIAPSNNLPCFLPTPFQNSATQTELLRTPRNLPPPSATEQNPHECLGTCHLRSAKPTELNQLEGTAASSEGVPTSSEGGATHYQSCCQSLYGRPASTTRPHASLSNSLATPPKPSLTASQPRCHHHRTHLPATHQPEPTRRQLSP